MFRGDPGSANGIVEKIQIKSGRLIFVWPGDS